MRRSGRICLSIWSFFYAIFLSYLFIILYAYDLFCYPLVVFSMSQSLFEKDRERGAINDIFKYDYNKTNTEGGKADSQ